ncbi:hypothetical protein GRI38_05130 [Altererythrobacter aurantiacus]|uniref:SH3-like domain-containing protein n=1 Tax=Parapontixanthobacter aurantiacus TaxID=1463599 RepID=A0A844ZEH4_9SPHN|nr:SH3 domain-containing protein [Parapontixanthobacter aurantiacus]MXO85407.1 hypothetical protein [Parapontixanthobacter aurantiacus]
MIEPLRLLKLLVAAILSFVLLSEGEAWAQEREVPYWASIRESATRLNMRVGPSLEFKIAWVYQRPGLPVKVVRLKDGWRLVEDPDGTKGWVRASLLSTNLSVYVHGEGLADMHEDPEFASAVRWRLEPGVVGSLVRCEDGWCRIAVGERRGWVRQDRLWGAGAA